MQVRLTVTDPRLIQFLKARQRLHPGQIGLFDTVHVEAHTRQVEGKPVHVDAHERHIQHVAAETPLANARQQHYITGMDEDKVAALRTLVEDGRLEKAADAERAEQIAAAAERKVRAAGQAESLTLQQHAKSRAGGAHPGDFVTTRDGALRVVTKRSSQYVSEEAQEDMGQPGLGAGWEISLSTRPPNAEERAKWDAYQAALTSAKSAAKRMQDLRRLPLG